MQIAHISGYFEQLNQLDVEPILFIVDDNDALIGSLTDGDVRRGLIKGTSVNEQVDLICQQNPKFIQKGERDINKIIDFREKKLKTIPVVDKDYKLVNVINFSELKSYLPIDAVIMAGGKGERLKPLTDNIPKPLLRVGSKAIIEHNIDRLRLFGIDDFWISVRYLGNQIEKHIGNGDPKNVIIKYIYEDEPLGTIGAVSLIEGLDHDYVLVTNSDILTNLNYEQFFLDFLRQDADFSVVTIPYSVDIPYAVLETSNGHVVSFKEKPTYTYFSNGGIYLMKKKVVNFIPKHTPFNATDLMEKLISEGLKVISFPLAGYWLDIGKPDDYQKAQIDIHSLE